MNRLARLSFLALNVLTVTTADGVSLGQNVAYNAQGTGRYSPVNGDYAGEGMGTHLYFGNVVSTPIVGQPLDFEWHTTTPQVTVAANGDEIYFNASGIVHLIPIDAFGTFVAVWTGDFTVVGGTGRFAKAQPAAEPLKVFVVNDPFTFTDPTWSFHWKLTGRILLR